MPIFCIVSVIDQTRLTAREAMRVSHKDYVGTIADRIVQSGATLDASGQPVVTQLFIQAESQAEAEEIAGRDPYVQAHCFLARAVGTFRQSHGVPLAG